MLGLLNQPHAAMGTWALARPVWHCSMRAAPQDKMLSDDEWAQIACDVMDRTGWIGDKGYIGNNMITPFRKPAGGELLTWQKEYNSEVNNTLDD